MRGVLGVRGGSGTRGVLGSLGVSGVLGERGVRGVLVSGILVSSERRAEASLSGTLASDGVLGVRSTSARLASGVLVSPVLASATLAVLVSGILASRLALTRSGERTARPSAPRLAVVLASRIGAVSRKSLCIPPVLAYVASPATVP